MYYSCELTIPAGTLESAPATEVLSLCNGRITEVRVLFPSGHGGLTYVQIWHHERQIIPATSGATLRGDDHVIEFPDRFEVGELPYEVEVRGWSPDATLDHTVSVALAVEALAIRSEQVAVYVGLPEGF